MSGATGPLRLDFPNAMRALIRGQRVTRLAWNDPAIYLDVVEEFLIIHNTDGKDHALLVRVPDLFADDWVVVERES